MQFDSREQGFPLLQNILIQIAMKEKKYDVNSENDFLEKFINFYNSGLSYYIYYYKTPGYIYHIEGTTKNIKDDYIILVPYIKKDHEELFQAKILSKKYFVLIGLNISNPDKNNSFRIINKVDKKKLTIKNF